MFRIPNTQMLKLSALEAEEARKRHLRETRMARLLQVRQQAKDIAEQRRRDYKDRLRRGLHDFQEDLKAEFERDRSAQLAQLEALHHAAITQLGAAHRDAAAAAEEDTAARFEREIQAVAHRRLARDRGAQAEGHERAVRAEIDRPMAELRERKELVRETEMSRALGLIAAYREQMVREREDRARIEAENALRRRQHRPLVTDYRYTRLHDLGMRELVRRHAGEEGGVDGKGTDLGTALRGEGARAEDARRMEGELQELQGDRAEARGAAAMRKVQRERERTALEGALERAWREERARRVQEIQDHPLPPAIGLARRLVDADRAIELERAFELLLEDVGGGGDDEDDEGPCGDGPASSGPAGGTNPKDDGRNDDEEPEDQPRAWKAPGGARPQPSAPRPQPRPHAPRPYPNPTAGPSQQQAPRGGAPPAEAAELPPGAAADSSLDLEISSSAADRAEAMFADAEETEYFSREEAAAGASATLDRSLEGPGSPEASFVAPAPASDKGDDRPTPTAAKKAALLDELRMLQRELGIQSDSDSEESRPVRARLPAPVPAPMPPRAAALPPRLRSPAEIAAEVRKLEAELSSDSSSALSLSMNDLDTTSSSSVSLSSSDSSFAAGDRAVGASALSDDSSVLSLQGVPGLKWPPSFSNAPSSSDGRAPLPPLPRMTRSGATAPPRSGSSAFTPAATAADANVDESSQLTDSTNCSHLHGAAAADASASLDLTTSSASSAASTPARRRTATVVKTASPDVTMDASPSLVLRNRAHAASAGSEDISVSTSAASTPSKRISADASSLDLTTSTAATTPVAPRARPAASALDVSSAVSSAAPTPQRPTPKSLALLQERAMLQELRSNTLGSHPAVSMLACAPPTSIGTSSVTSGGRDVLQSAYLEGRMAVPRGLQAPAPAARMPHGLAGRPGVLAVVDEDSSLSAASSLDTSTGASSDLSDSDVRHGLVDEDRKGLSFMNTSAAFSGYYEEDSLLAL